MRKVAEARRGAALTSDRFVNCTASPSSLQFPWRLLCVIGYAERPHRVEHKAIALRTRHISSRKFHGLGDGPKDYGIFAGEKSGGLNEFGIAAYKSTDDFAQREIDYILAIGGISVEYGKRLGRDIQLAELTGAFDAVFLGSLMLLNLAMAAPFGRSPDLAREQKYLDSSNPSAS